MEWRHQKRYQYFALPDSVCVHPLFETTRTPIIVYAYIQAGAGRVGEYEANLCRHPHRIQYRTHCKHIEYVFGQSGRGQRARGQLYSKH